jgi:hypothetical protein
MHTCTDQAFSSTDNKSGTLLAYPTAERLNRERVTVHGGGVASDVGCDCLIMSPLFQISPLRSVSASRLSRSHKRTI